MTLFELGKVEVTRAAANTLKALGAAPEAFLARHQAGDWGDVDDQWRQEMDSYVTEYEQLNSLYHLADGENLVISTAADRTRTRVFLEREYQRIEVDALLGYALWSESYDQERNPLIAVEEPAVERLTAGLTITRALDVGAGTGRHAIRLAGQGARVMAVDQSPEMLALARQRADALGLELDFDILPMERGLPFEAGQFDFVICALVLEHIADIAPVIAEFGRVLAPGGHLVISDLHPEVTALGIAASFKRPGMAYALPSIHRSRDDYFAALDAAGLAVVEAVDIPASDVPAGYLGPAFLEQHAERPFCLVMLARKGI